MFTKYLVKTRLNQPNQLFSDLSDKFLARDYFRDDELIQLPKIYYATDNLDQIDFEGLPGRFVVKPNHMSGRYFIVDRDAGKMYSGHARKPVKFDPIHIINSCRGWLSTKYSKTEVYYHAIKPLILIEEYLTVRYNLRFFVFHGRVGFLNCRGYDNGRQTSDWFTRDWRKMSVRSTKPSSGVTIAQPSGLEQYITAVEQAMDKSRFDLDFVRLDCNLVDSIDGEEIIYFGEFTITPAACLGPFKPASFERVLHKWVTGQADSERCLKLVNTYIAKPVARKTRVRRRVEAKSQIHIKPHINRCPRCGLQAN